MNKKIFFHIGSHKTGSTYIQQTLFANREILSSNGITYSANLIIDKSGHHGLYEAILAENRNVIERFCLSLADINIISSENFEYLNDTQIKYLLSFFYGYDIYVIFYKRNYADLIISSWQEYVKHGGVQSSYEYISNHVLAPFSGTVLNATNVVNRWLKNDFIHEVKIFNYDYLLYQNIDITKSMIDYIYGGEFNEIVYDGRMVNVSINFKKIEIIRLFNKFATSSGLHINDNLRNSFLALEREEPELVRLALEASVFSCTESNLSNSWPLNILEDEFYSHYQCDRMPRDHLNKKIIQQIEVGNNGCYHVNLMSLYEKVLLKLK
jgi:hypothetical protein